MASFDPSQTGPDPCADPSKAESRGAADSKGAAATGGATSKKAKTVHSRKTVIRGGRIFAVPFKTSAKARQGIPSGAAYGNVNPILNSEPKGKTRRSAAAAAHCGATDDTAGMKKKKLIPYNPNAPRNRLRPEVRRPPPGHYSQIKLEYGVAAVGRNRDPYMTVSKAATAASKKPIESRVGFTNDAMLAEVARKAHTKLLAD